MLHFSGDAQSTERYVYIAPFSATHDLWTFRQHTTILPGMHLRWKQYNSRQETIGTDIQFADDSWMRDKCEQFTDRCIHYTDNVGGFIHPNKRDRTADNKHISTEQRGWFEYDIDLTPFRGNRIQQIVAAYDNTANHSTGIVRAYFDDLRLVVPGGEATLETRTVGSGLFTVNPPGNTFPDGTTVNVSAQPAAGYFFRRWVIDGVANGWPNGPVNLTLKSNHIAAAYFAPLPTFNDISGAAA